MEAMEKARVRLDHWIHHNEHHQEEYELFADQLEEAGQKTSAEEVRKAARLTAESTEAMRKALASLEG